MKIPFSRIVCDGEEKANVLSVLESGWLTTAGRCLEFEEKFRHEVNAKFAVAVNSATAALHLAVEAIGVGPGDKVLVPTMTFTASAEVIRYVGADPVFLDVEPGSCLITLAGIETALNQTPSIKAVVVVHFGGQAADMPGIMKLCRARGVSVIEDAAHAFPTRCAGRMIGEWGDVTCFSFYANKTITTGEGGMLITNDERIAKRAKTMRLHGIDRDVWNRFTSASASWEYDVVAPGFKYNLPDLAAAVGLAQLKRAYEYRECRQKIAEKYIIGFGSLPDVGLPLVHGKIEDHAWHLFWLVLGPEARLNRDAFIEGLSRHEIGYSVHYKPLHRMTYYKNNYDLHPDSFPNAERHWKGCVSLPLYPTMSADEISCVVDCVRELLS